MIRGITVFLFDYPLKVLLFSVGFRDSEIIEEVFSFRKLNFLVCNSTV